MATIFIAHSAKDRKPLDFLNRALASTNVQAKYEEIEAITTGNRTTQQVKVDIGASAAIFIVLGPNVETLKHTRDWVVWESGNASALGKDIWVLEALEDSPKLSVVIPHLRHYVLFQYTDVWLAYLRSAVNSYDDSSMAPAALVGTGLGAVLGEGAGALIGGLAGLFLAAAARTKPQGNPITCPKCRAFYNVHLSASAMRCPVCNVPLRFKQPAPQS